MSEQEFFDQLEEIIDPEYLMEYSSSMSASDALDFDEAVRRILSNKRPDAIRVQSKRFAESFLKTFDGKASIKSFSDRYQALANYTAISKVLDSTGALLPGSELEVLYMDYLKRTHVSSAEVPPIEWARRLGAGRAADILEKELGVNFRGK